MKLDNLREKKAKEKIVMLTAYDYQMAKLLDKTGIDLILVGDSLGMVVRGYPNTKKVTMRNMLYHIEAVARGSKQVPVIGDMPINTCQTPAIALKNAKAFIKAGAIGVKVEGYLPAVIKKLISNSIPVMGHVGLLPQTAPKYQLVGKNKKEAERILQDAMGLDKLGVFSIVLECIPSGLARRITESVTVPTIGIGAGKYCDGQVLVINDLLGMDEDFHPKFVKRFANLSPMIKQAVINFRDEVKQGSFPDEEHAYF
ncbi:MAG: 3-methyl-2-oxobutanoate hydroxymethyltransferase [candidate division WOR-3 bacterium]|nr:3-methyl-2-oxobutanoate hydroxymethyltransferase [candidate division WOR-3 bacterium]